MQRLGELLLARGLVATSELHTALDACRREGGRLGTHLIRYGFVDESSLLEALSDQLGVPSATEAMLRRSPEALRRPFPPGLLQRLQAVPFAEENGRLKVAMTNPNDVAAQDELATLSRRRIEPYVATEAAIRSALGDPGLDVVERPRPGGIAEVRTVPPEHRWDGLWRAPRTSIADLLRLPVNRPAPAPGSVAASFPALTPIGGPGSGEEATVVDDATFQRRLQEARHRDDIGAALVQHTARYLPRVCLFAVHRGRASGWLASGRGVVLEDLQNAVVPLDGPSVFLSLSLSSSGPYHLGPLPGGELDARISHAMGDPAPAELLAVPVKVKERAVAFLVGDDPAERTVTAPVQEIVNAAGKAGLAFEILILKNKISG